MNVDILKLPLPWGSIQMAWKGKTGSEVNNLYIEFHKTNFRFPSENDTVDSWWNMWSRWNQSWPLYDVRYLEVVTRLDLIAIISKVYPDRVEDCVSALDVFAFSMAKNIARIQPAWTSLQDQVQGCVNALESCNSERVIRARDVLWVSIEFNRRNFNQFELNGMTALEDIMLAETAGTLSLRAHLLKKAHHMVPNLSESKRADPNNGSPDYESKLFGEI